MVDALDQACRDTLRLTRAREWQRRNARRDPAVIRIYDGHFQLRHIIKAHLGMKLDAVSLDTGKGVLKLRPEDPAAHWIWDVVGRMDNGNTYDVFIAVDHMGLRYSGRVYDTILRYDPKLGNHIEARIEHDYEQLKWRTLWATPSMPANFQPIKVWMLGGPASWAAATSLWMNLSRAHGHPSGVSWKDPLNSPNADYTDWPIVIRPFSYGDAKASGVPDGLVVSRFMSWHDAVQVMLDDGDVAVRVRRYLPGDPDPWDGANLSYGTLVVSFEYQKGLSNQVSGGLMEGIGQLVNIWVNAFVEGFVSGGRNFPIETGNEHLTGQSPPPEYQQNGYLGEVPGFPYVLFKSDSPAIVEFEGHQRPAKGLRLTSGGHSMPGVNELISAAIQAIGDALAAIPLLPIPPLGGVADALLKPFYEDVVLAFMTVYLAHRASMGSPYGLYEKFLTGSDKAYTLSATMVMRAGVKGTDATFTAKTKIIDGAPWWVGAPPYGDYQLDSRVFIQAPVEWSDRVYSERIKKLTWVEEPGKPMMFEPTIGDIDPSQDPFARQMRIIEKLVTGLKQLGVF